MTVLACCHDDPARVGLSAAAIRTVAATRGPIAALDQVAGRTNNALEWMEGRYRGIAHYPDELALIVAHVGYAVASRPPDEEGRQAVRSKLAGAVLGLYLDALDAHEAELARAQEGLAEHLKPKPAEPSAPVTPLPAGGLRDLFTGETRLPVHSDEPREKRPPQRRLF